MKNLLVFGLVLIAVSACIFGLIWYNANKIDTTTPVFKTQNINSITLFRYPDCEDGVEVPDEYMEEISAWLRTFTVGKKTKEVLCGINMFTFRVEYSDGTVLVNGTDTITIDGVTYHLKKGLEPECINQLFADNIFKEQ